MGTTPEDPHDWSWTNQIFLVAAYDPEDDKAEDFEMLVRARNPNEAFSLFRDFYIIEYLEHRWNDEDWEYVHNSAEDEMLSKLRVYSKDLYENLRWIFKLPVGSGPTCVLLWHAAGASDCENVSRHVGTYENVSPSDDKIRHWRKVFKDFWTDPENHRGKTWEQMLADYKSEKYKALAQPLGLALKK